MRLLSFIVIIVFSQCYLTSSLAFAQQPEVAHVKSGAAAPFTGLLVPEKRFIELLQAEIDRDKLKVQVRLETKFSKDLEMLMTKKLKQATEPEAWHQTASFNRWFGFTLGVVVTGLAIWGGTEVVKATNR